MCFEFFRNKCGDSRWFHENVSKMTAHFKGRNETEALLRFCVSEFFVRKALYLNTNLIFHVKWPRIRPLFGGHYSLAFRCFFFSPFAGFQSCIEKLNIVGTTSFFSTS